MLDIFSVTLHGSTHDELLNEHGLSDTCTSEETNLTTTRVGCKKIHDLDTGDQHFSGGGLVNEAWCFGVNWQLLLVLDRAALVDWVTGDVHDTSKGTRADGNHDGAARVGSFLATNETFGTVHSNASHCAFTQMLLRTSAANPLHLYHLMRATHTATSKISFVPPFSVSTALRMAGSCSVGNLTVVGR